MTKLSIPVVGVLCAAFGVAGFLSRAASEPTLTPQSPPTSSRDVSDLVARLRPLSKHPDEGYPWSGLTISFYGNGSAKIDLEMADDNHFVVSAPTLDAAVSALAMPSIKIQTALKGWQRTP